MRPTKDDPPFSRVPAQTAREICEGYQPAEKALELLRPEHTPRQFFDLLLAKELWVDAGRFLAQALARCEAVWWACVSVRQVSGSTATPKATVALAAAE